MATLEKIQREYSHFPPTLLIGAWPQFKSSSANALYNSIVNHSHKHRNDYNNKSYAKRGEGHVKVFTIFAGGHKCIWRRVFTLAADLALNALIYGIQTSKLATCCRLARVPISRHLAKK